MANKVLGVEQQLAEFIECVSQADEIHGFMVSWLGPIGTRFFATLARRLKSSMTVKR